ncbi:hypothetical protein ABT299_22360 [Spirillospora sp. NPDC000708]
MANPTAADRFRAFSPYHAGGMAGMVTLAHTRTEGDGEPSVKVGDLTIHATPALHTEETGRTRSAIGLAYQTPGGTIWYTSDTHLGSGLLDDVTVLAPEPALMIAHADATNLRPSPERAAACHLETRDVPAIAAALRPGTSSSTTTTPPTPHPVPHRSGRPAPARTGPARPDHPRAALGGGVRLALADGKVRHHLVDVVNDAGAVVAEFLRIA